MDKSKTMEVNKDCLIKARRYFKEENWGRAYPHYMMCFELFPNDRSKYENEFANTLYCLGIVLEENGQIEDLCKCYTQGMRYFPRNAYIFNNFGAHLLRLQEPEAALKYLKLAHSFDRSFLTAEKNLQSAKLNLFPRWHFRMLNDYKRNSAYRKAIHAAITPRRNRVLDIGTGSGLLSYYAAECKHVKKILAVESIPSLSTVAATALKDFPAVTVINNDSTNLDGSTVGLSNVLVTEIFDAGLFGEHILETLIHAWENLLEPSAKIVPAAADLYVTGISSKAVSSRHKFCNDVPELKLENMCITQIHSEPYEGENLRDRNVKYITGSRKVVSVNFSDVQQLNRLYSLADAIPAVTVKCVKSGTVDAFAVWFDLHLDEQISITTNPLKDSVICWEQAVIYLDHPIPMEEGQEIKLQVSCLSDRLQIKVLDYVKTCERCFKVFPDLITFLNDVQIVEAAGDLELPLRFNERNCDILDLNPFPLFAMFRAKNGFQGRYRCVAKTELDCDFINFVWQQNFGSKFDFKVIYSWELDDSLTEKSFDVIYLNPFTRNGTLCEDTFNNFGDYSLALKPNGLILPKALKLQIELIDSRYLEFCNIVDDRNLLGFEAAKYMNEFSVVEQWEVEPQSYRRKTLCNFIGGCDDLTNHFRITQANCDVNVPISGTANGVLYWYEIQFSGHVFVNTYKSLHYKGACFRFEHPIVVKSGDVVRVHVKQNKGFLKIYCNEDDDM